MVKALSFRGGAHPLHREHEGKAASADRAIEVLPAPDRVAIPMLQHLGAPCEPLVKKGDAVAKGQLIGKPTGLGANIHASISGVVAGIEPLPHPSGTAQQAVVIDGDGRDAWDPAIRDAADPDALSAQQIRDIVQQAGLVGMGGAAFPSFIKIPNKPGVQIDTLILNAAECEPYLTSDYRLMLERTRDILDGAVYLMRALPGAKAVIGIEDNKPQAVAALNVAIREGGYRDIEVAVFPTKYPQGSEKQLIYGVTGREVPFGKLPADVGCVVFNVGTAAAVADAVRRGRPLVERVVTVTGSGIARPANLLVRIGTPVQALLDHCGGLVGKPGKVISGGPMMGVTLYSLQTPVIKGMSGVLALEQKDAILETESACIRCGRCASVCPMGLQPLYISGYVLQRNFDKAAQFGAMDCLECGACSYTCPSRRPLTPCCRIAKKEIRELEQRKKQMQASRKEGA